MRSPVFLLSPLLLFSLLLFPASLTAQSSGQLFTASREQLDVTKVLLAQEAAWNKGDLDAYLAEFKDARETEAVLNGPVLGLANIRSAYHAAFPDKEAMGDLEQNEIQVRELGPDYALAIGKYRLARSRRNGGDAEGTFTDIFEKTADGWKLIFTQNT